MESPRGVEAAAPMQQDVRPLRASVAECVIQVVLAASLWALLAVAFSLTPSDQGLGTHQQLGLHPCTFYQMTGQPCPSCGMTTSFSLMAHGRVVEALVVQPFGALLFALTLAAALVLTVAVATRRSLSPLMYSPKTPLAICVMIVLWLASWGFKCAYGLFNGGYAP
jgi:hypothetical protein